MNGKEVVALTSLSSSRTLSMRYKSQHLVISRRTSTTDDLTVACFCIQKICSSQVTDA